MRKARHPNPFRLAAWLACILVTFYIAVPLVMVVLQSFNPRLTPWPETFTLRWYQMRVGGLGQALMVSMLISVPATLLAILISLPLGYAMTRYDFRGKEVVRQMVSLPIIIPGVVLGLAYLQIINSTSLRHVSPLIPLIAVHCVIVIPYAARAIIAGFERLDLALEEASATLGARPTSTFFRVTVPMLVPSILSGGIVGFARSLNDFVITLFLVQPGVVPLSVQVYQTTQYGIPQLTSALGTVLLAFSFVFVTIAEYLLRAEVEL